MKKIINSNTWEILGDDYFEVDAGIAEAICVLNKKGYKTKYCCEGHFDPRYYKDVCDISLLKETESNEEYPSAYILDVTEKDFVFLWTMPKATIYIMFDKDYNFTLLPEGFEKAPAFDEEAMDWSKSVFDCIQKRIDCYDGKKRRPVTEIQDDIDKSNKILLEWAINLPPIEE